MTKREEIEQTIRNLQNALNKAQEELRNLNSYERFVPEEDERYWFVNENGDVLIDKNNTGIDKKRIDFYNCFRTKEEAELEKEKILVRRMLENISGRLNEGKEMVWGRGTAQKYHIYFDHETASLELGPYICCQSEGVVYCLSDKFLEVAKKEIGEERLIKYIKGE